MTLEIPDEARKRLLASIKNYFKEQLEDEIGDLKAELFLQFIVKEIGPVIYNKAIVDAEAFLSIFQNTLQLLKELDRHGSDHGNENVRWRISEASKKSPLSATLTGAP